MAEFCDLKEFKNYLARSKDDYKEYTLNSINNAKGAFQFPVGKVLVVACGTKHSTCNSTMLRSINNIPHFHHIRSVHQS